MSQRWGETERPSRARRGGCPCRDMTNCLWLVTHGDLGLLVVPRQGCWEGRPTHSPSPAGIAQWMLSSYSSPESLSVPTIAPGAICPLT